jgi:uncharacterized RDD family membrane protein YckC
MTATTTAVTRSSTSAASLGRRVVARAVDVALLAATGLAVGAVTGFGIGWFAFQFVLVAAYLVGLDTRTGATVGKALLGLRVVAADGTHRRPTFAEAARREAFVVLGAVPFVGPVLGPVGWSAVAWSIHRHPTGHGVHDRFAGTQVVPAR